MTSPTLSLRVPMAMRLRFAADVVFSVRDNKGGAAMSQRRQFRMAMEKNCRRRLKTWPGNIR